MTPRNIHLAAVEDADPLSPQPSALSLPKLRVLTNDPLREYAARPGAVEPLPDSVAALILSRKGRCYVRRGQIVATIGGVEREYASRESLVLAEYNGTDRKVTWFANRRKPDCLHLCTDDGVYLETIPLKGEATWFSQDAASQAAHAAAVADRQAAARRLAALHAPDIAEAAAREQHNAAEIANRVREDERIVRTFRCGDAATGNGSPPRAGGHGAEPNGGRFTNAAAAHAAMTEAEGQHERHAARIVTAEKREASARAFGQALRETAPLSPAEPATPTTDIPTETW